MANMLFLATIVTFVLLTLYAFVYTNYRKNIKKYLVLQLKVPCCEYYETDSDDSDDEIVVVEEKENKATINPERKESILARL